MQDNLREFLKQLYRLQRVTPHVPVSSALTHPEFVALSVICRCGQEQPSAVGVKANLLSEQLMVSRPAVSKILNLLEEQAYIRRSIDPLDRRGVCVQLTEKGRSHLERAEEDYNRFLQGLLDRLGDDAEALTRILSKINTLFEEEYRS